VTPEYIVRVSPTIHERWSNGRRYYEVDRKRLAQLPTDAGLRPSSAALHWHNQRHSKLFVA
jgi:hypothetical protein